MEPRITRCCGLEIHLTMSCRASAAGTAPPTICCCADHTREICCYRCITHSYTDEMLLQAESALQLLNASICSCCACGWNSDTAATALFDCCLMLQVPHQSWHALHCKRRHLAHMCHCLQVVRLTKPGKVLKAHHISWPLVLPLRQEIPMKVPPVGALKAGTVSAFLPQSHLGHVVLVKGSLEPRL